MEISAMIMAHWVTIKKPLSIMKISKEIGFRAREGRAYGNLGIAYDSLGRYQKAIEYREKHLKIAKEGGDRVGEGAAFGNLGIAYKLLGYYQKAIEYHETT